MRDMLSEAKEWAKFSVLAQDIVKSLLAQLNAGPGTEPSRRFLFPNGIELISFDFAVGGANGIHIQFTVAGKEGVPGAAVAPFTIPSHASDRA